MQKTIASLPFVKRHTRLLNANMSPNKMTMSRKDIKIGTERIYEFLQGVDVNVHIHDRSLPNTELVKSKANKENESRVFNADYE